ncbi:MAG: hypothetical protein ACHP65_00810 [Legionellales bacterium]
MKPLQLITMSTLGAAINVAAQAVGMNTVGNDAVGTAATGAVMGASAGLGATFGTYVSFFSGVVVAPGRPAAMFALTATGFVVGGATGCKASYSFFSRHQARHRNDQQEPILNTENALAPPPRP